MFYIDNPTGVPVMPPVPPVMSLTTLYFTEGGNGIAPTYPGPEWFNIVQSELINVIKGAGIELDKSSTTQLQDALNKMFISADNENISALAGLVGAANKVAYFTGRGKMALANFSSVGRVMVGQATKADVIDYLELTQTVTLAGDAVPKTRKINNKALDADIRLTAADVGALPSTYQPPQTDLGNYYTRQECDARFLAAGSVNATFVRGFRMANYGVNGSSGVRDSAKRILTGIYATNGWDNPSTHESRQMQFDVNGTFYNVAWV
ncbi:phage tail protein [Citrobacter freundii]|nr:phage tail protein [Citrobacter freundii]